MPHKDGVGYRGFERMEELREIESDRLSSSLNSTPFEPGIDSANGVQRRYCGHHHPGRGGEPKGGNLARVRICSRSAPNGYARDDLLAKAEQRSHQAQRSIHVGPPNVSF